MPPIFPRKRYRNGEPVDPEPMNEDFQAIAGKLAGRLNEHDLDGASLKANAVVADGAYYAAHHISKGTSPNLTRGAPDYYAEIDSAAGDPVAEVDDTPTWQSLTDQGASDTLSLDITTGDDTLLIFATANHFAWTGRVEALAPSPTSPVRLQYAVRVDDVVIEDTITGAAFFPDPPPQQWYRASAVSSSDDFDYRHIQYVQGTVGINNAAHPVRIVRALPVTAGSHSVEVVARRLPPFDYKVDEDGEGNTVQVFNRQLFVLRIRGGSPYVGGVPDVTVASFEDGQTFSLAALRTNGQDALRAVANDLEAKHIERGALRHDHLPTVVYGQKAYGIAGSVVTYTGVYPGYGTDGAGWSTVNDGAGNDLELTGPTAGEWRLDTYPGLFVVLANVQVHKVGWAAGYSTPDDVRCIGIFAVALTNSAGTRTVYGVSEAYVNGHNPDTAVGDMLACETDVPLLLVLDSADLSSADRRIAKVEVLVSTWDGLGGGADAEVKTHRASICAFVLKGVHL